MILTFKDYLESKEQLIEALKQTPYTIQEYEVRKYCSITVGPSKEQKQIVGLKPKQKIVVEWLYQDINNPKPISVCFKGVKTLTEDDQFKMFWSSEKMKKWISKHTKEGIQNV